MAYDEDLKVCHSLTEAGAIAYAQMLEDAATELIVRSQHKALAWALAALRCIGLGQLV